MQCGGVHVCLSYLDAFPVEPDIPVSELVYEPHKPRHNSVESVHYKGEIHVRL